MIRYIIKRLVYAVLTLFVLISLTFFMMRMLPGDPFIGDKTVSATAMANMNAKYGLDKPVFVQYLMYMGNCLRGDLGISITYNRDVMTIISESFLVSADLGIRAIIFAVIIGILLGAVAAIKRGSVWDSVSMFIAMIGVSVPSFILGAVLQYFLGLQLRKTFGINLFPIQGWGKFNQTLLPSFALGLGSLATVSRLMRTSMLDVLDVIRKTGGALLEKAEMFDIYRGAQLLSGKKSVAFSLTFRNAERTLSDDDVNPLMQKILAACEAECSATLRL